VDIAQLDAVRASVGDSSAETLAAAKAAATALDSSDKYGKALAGWFVALGEWEQERRGPPPKPPWLDVRRLSDTLRTQRETARDAALSHVNIVHDNWEELNDERRAQVQADYDSQRDWTHERKKRERRAVEQEHQAARDEAERLRREKKAAEQQRRDERRAADEQLLERHATAQLQEWRVEVARKRKRQWAARRPPPASSSGDSESHSDGDELPASWGGYSAERREQRRERKRERHDERRLSRPPPTQDEQVAAVVDDMIKRLERQQRRSEIILDGCTLYDEDFILIDPRTRSPDDDTRAFVAYPDGSRSWVRPPGLPYFGITAAHLLVVPWSTEHGFCEPQQFEGASACDVAEVCILLRSFSRLLNLPSASRWADENLQQTRCAEHDWCHVRRVPCSTSSPERVLVAVLGAHASWSISSLAEQWQRGAWHVTGYHHEHFRLGDPIRPCVVRPPRSIEQLAICRPTRDSLVINEKPPWLFARLAIGERTCPRLCSRSTRELAPLSTYGSEPIRSTTLVCGSMRVIPPPPQPVCLRLQLYSRGLGGRVHLSMRTNSYDNPIHWQWRYICVCDSSMEELRMIERASTAYDRVRSAAFYAKQERERAKSARARMAAITRRMNAQKELSKGKRQQSHVLECSDDCDTDYEDIDRD